MAINEYLIGDLFKITNGSTPDTKNDSLWKDELNWYTPIDLREGLHTGRKITRGITNTVPENTILLSSRAPIGYVGISIEDSWHSQGIKGFININDEAICSKYFYYWLIHNNELIKSLGVGSTFAEISKQTLSTIKIITPSLQDQKDIIDIIEPIEELFIKFPNTIRLDTFENCKHDVKKIIDIIEPIEEMMSKLNSLEDKISALQRRLIIFGKRTNYEFIYNKGQQPNKETEGARTVFLNVSAANGKPNRLVTNEANIFIGDVTLSLDGNCGLVNNALEGFNGYLYKVSSDTFDNWQVYYSLLTKESQEIIKINETGTTIMHAPGAKKDLRLFEFEYYEVLENFFKLKIFHKLCFNKLNEQRDKLIKLLIK